MASGGAATLAAPRVEVNVSLGQRHVSKERLTVEGRRVVVVTGYLARSASRRGRVDLWKEPTSLGWLLAI